MNKEEFVKLAVSSGYANKHAAEQYAEKTGREEFTDNDFIELYHTSMHWEGCAADKGLRGVYGVNGRTTAMSNGIAGNSGNGTDWR